MTRRALVLGAGFGGLELVSRLSEELASDVETTLIDRNDAFVFGFSKLDVMFRREPLDAVRYGSQNVLEPGVPVGRLRGRIAGSLSPGGSRRLVVLPAWLLRPAARERNPEDYRDIMLGFRVARSDHWAAP